MAWTEIGFKNIQSMHDVKLELNPNGLNVFEARSETGKSIFIKCIRKAFFYKYLDAEERAIIISRPHNDPNKFGTFYIIVDYIFKVEFEFHFNRLYVRTYENAELIAEYRNEVPHNVATVLGLVVDYKSMSILNIMDNEAPMLFDSSDEEYNDRLLGFYTNHNDLISRKEFFEDTLALIDKQMSITEANIKIYSQKLTECTVIDNTEILRKLVELMEKYDKELTYMDSLTVLLGDLKNVLSDDVRPVVDVTELSELSLQLGIHNFLIKNLESIHNLPEPEPIVDTSEIEDLHKQLLSYDRLSNMLKSLGSVVDERPVLCDRTLSELRELSALIDYHIMLYNLLNDLDSFNDNLPICDVSIIDDLNKAAHNLALVDSIIDTMSTLIPCIEEIEKCEKRRVEIRQEMQDTLKSFKRCALCGQEIKEVDSVWQ